MRKLILVMGTAFLCGSVLGQQRDAAIPDSGFFQRDVVANNALLICEACLEPAVKITLPAASSVTVYSTNILYYKQTITIATSPLKLIRKISADLSYFEFQPESDDCVPCNKNSATLGNFDNCTILNLVATGTGSHAINWNFTPPANPGSFPAVINITLPPTVKCCTGTIRWCVRYIIEFDDCSVCSKTVCYEKKKTTTTPAPNPPANPTFQN